MSGTPGKLMQPLINDFLDRLRDELKPILTGDEISQAFKNHSGDQTDDLLYKLPIFIILGHSSIDARIETEIDIDTGEPKLSIVGSGCQKDFSHSEQSIFCLNHEEFRYRDYKFIKPEKLDISKSKFIAYSTGPGGLGMLEEDVMCEDKSHILRLNSRQIIGTMFRPEYEGKRFDVSHLDEDALEIHFSSEKAPPGLFYPGCVVPDKGHEFHGEPLTGGGLGIIRLDHESDTCEELFKKLEVPSTISQGNEQDAQGNQDNQGNEQDAQDNQGNEQDAQDNQGNEQDAQGNQGNEQDAQGNQGNQGNEQDAQGNDDELEKIWKDLVKTEKDNFKIVKTVARGEKSDSKIFFLKKEKMEEEDKALMALMKKKARTGKSCYMSEIIDIGPPGIYISLSCSPLFVYINDEWINDNVDLIRGTVDEKLLAGLQQEFSHSFRNNSQQWDRMVKQLPEYKIYQTRTSATPDDGMGASTCPTGFAAEPGEALGLGEMAERACEVDARAPPSGRTTRSAGEDSTLVKLRKTRALRRPRTRKTEGGKRRRRTKKNKRK